MQKVKEATGKQGVCVMYHAPSGQGCRDGINCKWLHDHEMLRELPKIRAHKLERQQEVQLKLDEQQYYRDQLDVVLGGGYKETKLPYHVIRLPGFHEKSEETRSKLEAIEDTVKTDVKRSKPDSISPEIRGQMSVKLRRSMASSSATASNPQD
jgi:hypothetical protein